jgi:hypothetical protein
VPLYYPELKNLIDCVCADGKTATLRDIFEYRLKQNNPKLNSELIRKCLTLIDRNFELIEKPPTVLGGLSSLSSEEENSLPVPEEDKLPEPSLEEEKVTQQLPSDQVMR